MNWLGPGCPDPSSGQVWLVNNSGDSFNDVIDVGEVAGVMTMVVNVNWLTSKDPAREQEQRHVWATPGAVYRKKSQPCDWNAEQMSVGVGHQFIGFFRGRIHAQRVVDTVVR